MRTFGPNDASGVVWALFRLRGPSLAFVGRHWLLNSYCGPSWACVGLRWPSLATVGFRGPALSFVGRHWLLWAFMGLHWPLLAFVGRRWLLGNKNKIKILYIKKITHLGPFFPLLPIKTPFDDLIYK